MDGILKLLNAICSTNPSAHSLSQPGSSLANVNSLGSSLNVASSIGNGGGSSNISSSFSSMSVASMLINNLDISLTDDTNRCSLAGAEIARAIMNFTPTEQNSYSSSNINNNSNNNNTTNNNSDQSDFNQINQILSACKCLYVSHRKISIYLQNLQELEKLTGKKKHLSSNDILNLSLLDSEMTDSVIKNSMLEDDENSAPRRATMGPMLKKSIIAQAKLQPFTKVNTNVITSTKKVNAPIKLHNDVLTIQTTKIMLKDIRIPLSWKYSDHLKATKNSGKLN